MSRFGFGAPGLGREVLPFGVTGRRDVEVVVRVSTSDTLGVLSCLSGWTSTDPHLVELRCTPGEVRMTGEGHGPSRRVGG